MLRHADAADVFILRCGAARAGSISGRPKPALHGRRRRDPATDRPGPGVPRGAGPPGLLIVRHVPQTRESTREGPGVSGAPRCTRARGGICRGAATDLGGRLSTRMWRRCALGSGDEEQFVPRQGSGSTARGRIVQVLLHPPSQGREAGVYPLTGGSSTSGGARGAEPLAAPARAAQAKQQCRSRSAGFDSRRTGLTERTARRLTRRERSGRRTTRRRRRSLPRSRFIRVQGEDCPAAPACPARGRPSGAMGPCREATMMATEPDGSGTGRSLTAGCGPPCPRGCAKHAPGRARAGPQAAPGAGRGPPLAERRPRCGSDPPAPERGPPAAARKRAGIAQAKPGASPPRAGSLGRRGRGPDPPGGPRDGPVRRRIGRSRGEGCSSTQARNCRGRSPPRRGCRQPLRAREQSVRRKRAGPARAGPRSQRREQGAVHG
jgi:hypothetical protein